MLSIVQCDLMLATSPGVQNVSSLSVNAVLCVYTVDGYRQIVVVLLTRSQVETILFKIPFV